MNKYYLGIDTSAYTSSIALMDEELNIVADLRIPLKVKSGERGLRQQEAVFQHLNNFPLLIDRLSDFVAFKDIVQVGVSSRPRNIEDSYMPVFLFGKNQAYILSKLLNIGYKEFSHQENHIGSGLMDNMELLGESFIALHISGGTSEFLKVNSKGENLNIEVIGRTLDISFGQLIDRIGVKLGINFPCGREMDLISKGGKLIDISIPISIKDNFHFNLSGLENFFNKLIDKGIYRDEDIIVSLFNILSIIIESILKAIHTAYGLNKLLITGGVASNSYIRGYLEGKINYMDVHFSRRDLSSDNGVGNSLLAKIMEGRGWIKCRP